jgi:hypothetical protein
VFVVCVAAAVSVVKPAYILLMHLLDAFGSHLLMYLLMHSLRICLQAVSVAYRNHNLESPEDHRRCGFQ